jgi:hypothetical protein
MSCFSGVARRGPGRAGCLCGTGPAQATELVGFASLPADTFSPGPTSGQFVSSANGRTLPLVNQQAVQGFSAVLPGPRPGTFRVMPDNGFGTQANSPDAVLRVYTVEPDFRRWNGRSVAGTGAVRPVDVDSGRRLASFSARSHITLADPLGRLGFTEINQLQAYPYAGSGAGQAGIPVDARIRAGHWLTGADLDIESMRVDHHGHYWFGEEFGPFLVKTDARAACCARGADGRRDVARQPLSGQRHARWAVRGASRAWPSTGPARRCSRCWKAP